MSLLVLLLVILVFSPAGTLITRPNNEKHLINVIPIFSRGLWNPSYFDFFFFLMLISKWGDICCQMNAWKCHDRMPRHWLVFVDLSWILRQEHPFVPMWFEFWIWCIIKLWKTYDISIVFFRFNWDENCHLKYHASMQGSPWQKFISIVNNICHIWKLKLNKNYVWM